MLRKWGSMHAARHRAAFCAAIVALLLIGGAGMARADETFALSSVVGIPGGFTSADIVFVDPAAGVLAMADRSNKSVDIIDLNIPDETLARQIIPSNTGCSFAPHCAFQGRVNADNEISGPNGVITVNQHSELWVTDAPETTAGGTVVTFPSTIKVLDIRTGKVLDVINNGGNHRADEIAVDPRDHVFIAANPADTPSPFVTLISTDADSAGHHAIIKKIFFNGHDSGAPKVDPACGLEQATWDPDSGLFFMAVPSFGPPDTSGNCTVAGGVVVINPKGDADDMRVIHQFTVPNCQPNGSALGPDNELFLGCANQTPMVILNIRTGHQTLVAGLQGGCDEVWFNPGDNHFLGSCDPDGTPATQVLGIIDADPIAFDSNVPTQPTADGGGSHALSADSLTNRVFVSLPASATNNAICAAAAPPANTLGCFGVYSPSGTDDAKEERDRRHFADDN
jgi:hypothetical protein